MADTREWALRNLESPLTISELARHAGLSERSLIRRFTSETGMPPLQWLNHARVGAARELLEVTDHSIDRVASGCGLGTAANLRLHFRRTLQTTPTSYRRTFQRKSAATA
ncbi:MAG TPA: helix-turn-helix domain-containing protein [Mycobacterium sp.]